VGGVGLLKLGQPVDTEQRHRLASSSACCGPRLVMCVESLVVLFLRRIAADAKRQSIRDSLAVTHLRPSIRKMNEYDPIME